MSPAQKSDPFYRLKFMGYCLSQLSPEGMPMTMDDYVNYAKFQLSVDKHLLMEDPIWDRYTDEAILVEFFGNLFSKSKEKLKEFESTLEGSGTTSVDAFSAWADQMIAKNQRELEDKAKDLEDSVSFTPEALGE